MPIEIRRKDVKTLIAQGLIAQLLEVLPETEFNKEHLPKAINIPLQSLTAENTKHLRKDQGTYRVLRELPMRFKRASNVAIIGEYGISGGISLYAGERGLDRVAGFETERHQCV